VEIRAELIKEALDLTMEDRNETYGAPEVNLACQGELMEVYRKYAGDKYDPSHDVAIFNIIVKLGRIATGKPSHKDNYADMIAYTAIAFECQELNSLK